MTDNAPGTIQAMAVPEDLAQDILSKLIKLPWEDANSTIKRLQACQIVNMEIRQPETQPHGDSD